MPTAVTLNRIVVAWGYQLTAVAGPRPFAARSPSPDERRRVSAQWMPHSVLRPAQRPERRSLASVGRVVHGMQPIDG